jgi:hypothetical protein
MKNLKVSKVMVPFLVLLGASATACGGGESGDDAGSGATAGTGGSTAGTGGSAAGTGGSTACGAAVTASPANNYTFSSTLTFPAVSVQPDSELSFDWSAVTKDFLGHDVDPMADIEQVTLLMWSLTLEELQTKLNADDLAQRELTTVPATLFTEKMVTSGDMLDFTLAGNPVLPEEIMPFFSATEYPPAEHTYTVMVASGTVLGKGTRMIQSFRLDPASTNTDVVVTANSTTLDYDVDLLSLTPTAVPAGTAAVTIDWSGMTVNATRRARPNFRVSSSI